MIGLYAMAAMRFDLSASSDRWMYLWEPSSSTTIGVSTWDLPLDVRNVNTAADSILYDAGGNLVRGVKSWLATVPDYRNFLGSNYARSTLALSDTALRMILRENAERLFRIGP